MDNKNYKGLIVKLCCFIASFSLWVYISSIYDSRKTDIIYNIPVEILGNEDLISNKFIVVPKEDININLTVEGENKVLTKLKKSSFQLSVDLSDYIKNNELKKGTIKAKVNVIKKPDDITIINEEELTASIEIDDYVEKNISITVKEVDTDNKDIKINSITTNPEKIKVSGANTSVDKVNTLEVVLTYDDIINEKFAGLSVVAKDKEGREIKDVELKKDYVDVEVNFDNIKEVKVLVDTIGVLPSNLKLDEIKINKATVKITGDKSILDDIEEVQAESINLDKISSTKEFSKKIILPKGVKAVSSASVNIEVVVSPVDKDESEDTTDNNGSDNDNNNNDNNEEISDDIIEKNLTLNITVKNLPDTLKVDFTNKTVTVTISGKKSIIDNITEEEFSCYLDGSVLTTAITSAKVLLESSNKEVTIKSYTPQTIDINVINVAKR